MKDINKNEVTMNNIKKYIGFGLMLSLAATMTSCSDEFKEDEIGRNYDITFNEHELGRFSYKILDKPFLSGDKNSGVITLNAEVTGNNIEGGFILSNKNWRSYPWCLSEDYGSASVSETIKKEAVDSCRFSVYTNYGNTNKTYAVAVVKDDKAFFTLESPSIIEHILVANTTYNYLLMTYSSYYTAELDNATQKYLPFKIDPATGNPDPKKRALIANPKIPDAALKGRFSLPTPDGEPVMHLDGASVLAKRKAGKVAADKTRAEGGTLAEIYADSVAAAKVAGDGWFKLIIKGYRNGVQVGTIDYYMGAKEGAVADKPKLNHIKEYWYAVDLTSLGEVDKVVFNLDSSDKDANGKMRMPPYFCLDGIRLKNRVK